MFKKPINDTKADLELASQIARGDQNAFAVFIDRYGPRIQSLVRRYTACDADREDLIQEIFIALYKSVGSYKGGSTLSTWSYSVALNHCLKHVKRRPQPTDSLDSLIAEPSTRLSMDPPTRAAQSELARNVQTALMDLSAEQRDVVILHELHELTYSECADVLHIPIGTVKSRLFYAFRTLKQSLASYVSNELDDISTRITSPANAAMEATK